MRCRAGKSEPGFTTKAPLVTCSIRRAMPRPCRSPASSDFSTSRSRVPCSSVVGGGLIASSYRQPIGGSPITYRMSIGGGAQAETRDVQPAVGRGLVCVAPQARQLRQGVLLQGGADGRVERFVAHADGGVDGHEADGGGLEVGRVAAAR